MLEGLTAGAFANAKNRSNPGHVAPDAQLVKNTTILYGGTVNGQVHATVGNGPITAQSNMLILDDSLAFIKNSDSEALDIALSGSSAANAHGNVVIIRAGTVKGNITGGYGGEESTGNCLFMEGGNVSGRVTGGISRRLLSSGNAIIMTGGSAGKLVGGYAGQNGAASGNSVYFSGGKTGGITGGISLSNSANNNAIYISGGEFVAPERTTASTPVKITGGQSLSGPAVNNTISISGSPDLQHCGIYGGDTDAGGALEAISGNVLILERDFKGWLPEAQNLEIIRLKGTGVVIPTKGYTFHKSVLRLENNGRLEFSNKLPGRLFFSKTQYSGEHGELDIRIYSRHQVADRVYFENGSLLNTPVRIRLKNPQDLKLGMPVLVMEIKHAASMRGALRRNAAVWAEEPRLTGKGADAYRIMLTVTSSSDGKDQWMVEKRKRTAAVSTLSSYQ